MDLGTGCLHTQISRLIPQPGHQGCLMPVSVSHIIEALSSLGGQADVEQIVTRVLEIAPEPLPKDVTASVRGRIQERCSQADSYKGRADIFESVHGVGARRGVWRLRSDTLNPSNADLVIDGADAFLEAPEGRAMLRTHLRRERSRKLITEFKRSLSDLTCQACDFDFSAAYGSLGAGYIEAHHTVPVASLDDMATTKITDLAALCANCHRVIHRNGLIPVYQLRSHMDSLRHKGYSGI
jgi:putative restriction endonuclease